MKRINTTNIFLLFIMVANFFIAIQQYLHPTRDVTIDNVFGWLCSLSWFCAYAIKEYQYDNN